MSSIPMLKCSKMCLLVHLLMDIYVTYNLGIMDKVTFYISGTSLADW